MSNAAPCRFIHTFTRNDRLTSRADRPEWWHRLALSRWYEKKIVRLAQGSGVAFTPARFAYYRVEQYMQSTIQVYGEYSLLEGCEGQRFKVHGEMAVPIQ